VLSSSWFIAGGDDPAGMGQNVASAFIDAVSAAFQDACLQRVAVCIATGDRGTDSSHAHPVFAR